MVVAGQTRARRLTNMRTMKQTASSPSLTPTHTPSHAFNKINHSSKLQRQLSNNSSSLCSNIKSPQHQAIADTIDLPGTPQSMQNISHPLSTVGTPIKSLVYLWRIAYDIKWIVSQTATLWNYKCMYVCMYVSMLSNYLDNFVIDDGSGNQKDIICLFAHGMYIHNYRSMNM